MPTALGRAPAAPAARCPQGPAAKRKPHNTPQAPPESSSHLTRRRHILPQAQAQSQNHHLVRRARHWLPHTSACMRAQTPTERQHADAIARAHETCSSVKVCSRAFVCVRARVTPWDLPPGRDVCVCVCARARVCVPAHTQAHGTCSHAENSFKRALGSAACNARTHVNTDADPLLPPGSAPAAAQYTSSPCITALLLHSSARSTRSLSSWCAVSSLV
jgi:hypothetical protein